ncbi:MAG: twin-arginine translocase TatA/TatE family subunit [Alphaproteobacteria bacterium]
MSFGIKEILIILVVVFVVFGAGRLPRMMEDVGKGIKSFRKGLDDDDKDGKK